jgi:hypothetical protein
VDDVVLCCCWTKEWNISNGLLFDDTLFIGGDEAAAAGVAVVADEGPNGSKRLNGLLAWRPIGAAQQWSAGTSLSGTTPQPISTSNYYPVSLYAQSPE